MPVYRETLPDGTPITVEGPNEPTPEQWKQIKDSAAVQQALASAHAPKETGADKIVEGGKQFLKGGVKEAGRLAGSAAMFPIDLTERVAQSAARAAGVPESAFAPGDERRARSHELLDQYTGPQPDEGRAGSVARGLTDFAPMLALAGATGGLSAIPQAATMATGAGAQSLATGGSANDALLQALLWGGGTGALRGAQYVPGLRSVVGAMGRNPKTAGALIGGGTTAAATGGDPVETAIGTGTGAAIGASPAKALLTIASKAPIGSAARSLAAAVLAGMEASEPAAVRAIRGRAPKAPPLPPSPPAGGSSSLAGPIPMPVTELPEVGTLSTATTATTPTVKANIPAPPQPLGTAASGTAFPTEPGVVPRAIMVTPKPQPLGTAASGTAFPTEPGALSPRVTMTTGTAPPKPQPAPVGKVPKRQMDVKPGGKTTTPTTPTAPTPLPVPVPKGGPGAPPLPPEAAQATPPPTVPPEVAQAVAEAVAATPPLAPTPPVTPAPVEPAPVPVVRPPAPIPEAPVLTPPEPGPELTPGKAPRLTKPRPIGKGPKPLQPWQERHPPASPEQAARMQQMLEEQHANVLAGQHGPEAQALAQATEAAKAAEAELASRTATLNPQTTPPRATTEMPPGPEQGYARGGKLPGGTAPLDSDFVTEPGPPNTPQDLEAAMRAIIARGAPPSEGMGATVGRGTNAPPLGQTPDVGPIGGPPPPPPKTEQAFYDLIEAGDKIPPRSQTPINGVDAPFLDGRPGVEMQPPAMTAMKGATEQVPLDELPVHMRVPEIDQQLTANPELAQNAAQVIQDIAKNNNIPVDQVTDAHVRAEFPGQEQSPVRAMLNYVRNVRQDLFPQQAPPPQDLEALLRSSIEGAPPKPQEPSTPPPEGSYGWADSMRGPTKPAGGGSAKSPKAKRKKP